MTPPAIDPIKMLRPRRKITGISATLLPFTSSGTIDWAGFKAHVERTSNAGLIPAVNMDTGFANLLTDQERIAVLDATRATLGGRPFVAGAFVGDRPGAAFDRDAYLRAVEQIAKRGATSVIFQSYGLTGLPDPELIGAYEQVGKHTDGFIAFELGTMSRPSARFTRSTRIAGCWGEVVSRAK